MTAAPPLQLRFRPPIPIYSLTGFVTEPVAVAVEGAAVAVLDGPHKGKSTMTDRAGSYALIGVDGGFTIQVTKDGYASAAKGVTITTQSLAVDVEITPLAINRNISGNWTVTLEPASGCPSPLTRQCQDVSRIHRPAKCATQHHSVGRDLRHPTTTDRHHP